MNEREENFIRIAEQRVNKIIDAIDKLTKLTNTSHYSYTEEQVDKMFKSIERSLKNARSSFDSKKAKEHKFKF